MKIIRFLSLPSNMNHTLASPAIYFISSKIDLFSLTVLQVQKHLKLNENVANFMTAY